MHGRAEAPDRNVLVEHKLAAGQADSPSIERGTELNRIPVVRIHKRLAEGAHTIIIRGGHGKRRGLKPAIYLYQPEADSAVFPRQDRGEEPGRHVGKNS